MSGWWGEGVKAIESEGDYASGDLGSRQNRHPLCVAPPGAQSQGQQDERPSSGSRQYQRNATDRKGSRRVGRRDEVARPAASQAKTRRSRKRLRPATG